MSSAELLPLDVWTSQITQASIPANQNALRVQVLTQPAISILSAQPASPAEDDLYIIGSSPTGAQWSTFTTNNLAIYKSGTWLEFTVFQGMIKTVDDTLYLYDSGTWAELTLPPAPSYANDITITASETLAITRAGKFINANHATVAIAITVPPNSSVAFDIDTEIHIRQVGAAAVSVVAGSGVTIQYPASQGLKIKEKFGVATLKKVDTDTWALFGMISA